MAKKILKKIAAKDADQYMLRLPPGLRDRIASRAAQNGRSMNTEIVEAIEKYLEGSDRMTRVWEFIEKHREHIEEINYIADAVRVLENRVDDIDHSGTGQMSERRQRSQQLTEKSE